MKTKDQVATSSRSEGSLHKVKASGITKAKQTSATSSSRKQNGITTNDDIDVEQTRLQRHKLIARATQIHYPSSPLYIARGIGQYLYDDQGGRYLDLMNNVAHVGHCHPDVVKAGQDQMAELNTNSRYLHKTIIKCAEKLTGLLPEKLKVCFFVNSGTEANDLAIRLARTYTKKNDIVVLEHAYHGHSVAVINISPYKFNHLEDVGEGKKDFIHVVPQPDCYRGEYCGDVDDNVIGEAYADKAIKVMDDAVANGRQIGMFIAESMISCGGQMLIPKGYLKKVYAHVRKLGGICVADEVQVGFGRSGKSGYWGFDRHDVVPDIVSIGKPFGNGHPVSVVVTTEDIAVAMESTGVAYFNTFGGNPVSMSIALSVMEVIERENLQENAEVVGEYCQSLLREQKLKHKLIGDVRGCGLFIGIDLVRDPVTKEPATEAAKALCLKLRYRGVLISRDGPANNVLKVKPPMVVTKDDMKDFVEQLDAALTEVEESSEMLSS